MLMWPTKIVLYRILNSNGIFFSNNVGTKRDSEWSNANMTPPEHNILTWN